MKRSLLYTIVLWWMAFATIIALSVLFPRIADSGLGAACILVRFLIPLKSRRMHLASVILFLAAMLLALGFTSTTTVLGLLALLCLAAYFILVIVSDILQFVQKSVHVGK
jgi:hypothetical protein